jgi:hypothetical protein
VVIAAASCKFYCVGAALADGISSKTVQRNLACRGPAHAGGRRWMARPRGWARPQSGPSTTWTRSIPRTPRPSSARYVMLLHGLAWGGGDWGRTQGRRLLLLAPSGESVYVRQAFFGFPAKGQVLTHNFLSLAARSTPLCSTSLLSAMIQRRSTVTLRYHWPIRLYARCLPYRRAYSYGCFTAHLRAFIGSFMAEEAQVQERWRQPDCHQGAAQVYNRK